MRDQSILLEKPDSRLYTIIIIDMLVRL
ncbi:hypothetical protein WL1483_4045 [Aeromonas schubertii]|uniref:Uncharacterized protein n=1 Tax=Aeromonas schubertii TaxID=652 RepID=A0A0S2SP46_9GAMM|nr:hypothetical protein WL1483_4045 [Aeromonas schubertii]